MTYSSIALQEYADDLVAEFIDGASNTQDCYIRSGVAAALRFAAGQLAPFPGRYPLNEYMQGGKDARQDAYQTFLAIADQLEAQPTTTEALPQ